LLDDESFAVREVYQGEELGLRVADPVVEPRAADDLEPGALGQGGHDEVEELLGLRGGLRLIVEGPDVHRVEQRRDRRPVLGGYYKPEAPLLKPFLAKAGVTIASLPRVLVCEDWPTIVELAASGRGYAVVPESFLPRDTKGLATLKLPHSVVPRVEFWAVVQRELLQIPAYQAMWSALTR
jgi:DNA-binding transcriptional LysR family regulator